MSAEPDFRKRFPIPASASFLPSTRIELVRRRSNPGFPKVALFDFDGTLSLIREGWPQIMIPMMVEELIHQGAKESESELETLVSKFVHELTGKQTIYQMMRLVEEIRQRGGSPLEPLAYKQRYHDLLSARIASRREDLRTGAVSPEQWLVPGSRELLTGLQVQGVELYLASGTDLQYVREEVALLGLTPFFGPRIYGALARVEDFSKEQVIRQIVSDANCPPTHLVGFGDGYVEIDNLVDVGALAVGVASDEQERQGKIDPWKRNRLIEVGAHMIIADYHEQQTLLNGIFRSEH